MNTYQLSSENVEKEGKTIQQILHNVGFVTSIAKNSHGKKKHEKDNKKVQWAKFTCTGKDTRAITKAFKITTAKITFCTDNTIGKLLATRYCHTKCKHDNCGICQITCAICNNKYIGQTLKIVE